MGTFASWRRAFGAIKDSTTVGLVKVNSNFKDIDIAIVKATNHEECPPKDLHVRRIIVATSFAVPRADVGYCIHTLSKRLTKTKNWIVAVKTLMVFHRIILEGDPSFREELLIYSRRRHVFQIPEFRDDSSQLAWDCSSWIRKYATFLEERLECNRVLGFYIETERLTATPAIGKVYSRTRLMNIDELLDQLPNMQQLLHRLFACQPEGAAYHNRLIQQALTLVLKESLKICGVINDGVNKLIESFFNLSKEDAVTTLNVYKKATKQAELLADFYNLGKHLRLAMNLQFPTLSQLPSSFLATMEEYVKASSSNGLVSNNNLHQDIVEERSPREIREVENKEVLHNQKPDSKPLQKAVEEKEALPLISIDDDDCQGLNDTSTKVTGYNDNNTSGSPRAYNDYNTSGSPLTESSSSGWNDSEKASSLELAIVPLLSNTNNNTNISQAKLGGGLDKMLLYSLYEDNIVIKNQLHTENGMKHYSLHHPHHERCIMSGVAPSTTMHTIWMDRKPYIGNQQSFQQQYHDQYQQQQNMLNTYYYQQSSNKYLHQQKSNSNLDSFGDGINYAQGNHRLM